MSDSFECAWQGVRPVPHVTIDFGNGRTLERTLHGNIATYFCTPAGQVFDLVPGLVSRQEYSSRLVKALDLHERLRVTSDPRSFLAEVHSAPDAAVSGPAFSSRMMDLASLQVFDLSKMRVERKVEDALDADEAAILEVDTRMNVQERYPLARGLLSEHPLATPAELTHAVYLRVLGVDLSDPYLGLAPTAIGGEGGRN